MFFKKKKSGAVELKLNEEQFCAVLEEKAPEVTRKYCVIANADTYNLLYRDGRFLGTPRPFGGAIYPFSMDPTEEGYNSDKKKFHTAKLVYLSKDSNLKVYWGTETPFMMEDPITHEPYRVGARGVFFVNIDPDDAARKADMFYSKCLTQRNAELFNTEALRDFLREAFVIQIGARIQKYIEKNGRTLANYVGLQPSEILAISKEVYPELSDIFASYGLTIVKESSAGSILQGLVVEKVTVE
jgi:hypothetical protein